MILLEIARGINLPLLKYIFGTSQSRSVDEADLTFDFGDGRLEI